MNTINIILIRNGRIEDGYEVNLGNNQSADFQYQRLKTELKRIEKFYKPKTKQGASG